MVELKEEPGRGGIGSGNPEDLWALNPIVKRYCSVFLINLSENVGLKWNSNRHIHYYFNYSSPLCKESSIIFLFQVRTVLREG